MPTTQTQQPQMGLTFQDVWAALMETRARQEEFSEQQRKTDELIRKTDEQMRKTDEQMDRSEKRFARIEKNLGGFGNSLGELIETLFAAKLWEKFDQLSYYFKQAYQRVRIYDTPRHALTEIDILLTDDTYVMAIEVKTQFDKESDVDYHLKRMEWILKWPPAECKGKKLLGAIAGGIVSPDVRDYAHSVGFFVLELTGESVTLAERPAGFVPHEWQSV
jgi:hypothetical protein